MCVCVCLRVRAHTHTYPELLCKTSFCAMQIYLYNYYYSVLYCAAFLFCFVFVFHLHLLLCPVCSVLISFMCLHWNPLQVMRLAYQYIPENNMLISKKILLFTTHELECTGFILTLLPQAECLRVTTMKICLLDWSLMKNPSQCWHAGHSNQQANLWLMRHFS